MVGFRVDGGFSGGWWVFGMGVPSITAYNEEGHMPHDLSQVSDEELIRRIAEIKAASGAPGVPPMDVHWILEEARPLEAELDRRHPPATAPLQ
jgi:hypothetical protein